MEKKQEEILTTRIKNLFKSDRFALLKCEAMLESVVVKETEILLVVEVKNSDKAQQSKLKHFLQNEIKEWGYIEEIKLIYTSQTASGQPNDGKPPNLMVGRHPNKQDNNLRPKSVDKIIAVASGKGGVGKSTFASNVAFELVNRGFKVGVLDADMHGPSQPTLLGSHEKPKIDKESKMIIPVEVRGLKFISIGLMIPNNQALIWRGPMLMGALEQFLKDVQWGNLDFLIIDLPPGTGDVQLTLAQKANINGSVIISTPQDVALIDARKAIQMFNKLNVKVIGLVENMSTHICPNCGHEDNIFGTLGVKREAEALNLPFLGDIPLDRKIRENGDKGTPTVIANPHIPSSVSISGIVDELMSKL